MATRDKLYRSRWSCAWGEAAREYWMAVRHKETNTVDKYFETAIFPLLVLDRYKNAQQNKEGKWFFYRTVENFGFRPPYSLYEAPEVAKTGQIQL
jgi:hypothetical protein